MEKLTKEQMKHIRSKSDKKTELTEPPLCRIIREGVAHFCTNCGSTMSRIGFMMLFGERYCDNDKCPNSKPLKNYR